jgi:ATP-dependent RNA helicase DeaD
MYENESRDYFLNNFLSLGISESFVKTLRGQGIAVPTPIQEQAIPLLMEGRDIIAQSQTGTGKTLAFVLPILEKVDSSENNIQALVVTPTRELALQITNEVKKLIEDRSDIRVLAIYGGQDVESQLKKLKNGRHIVIGTPGRLLDHIRRQTVDFSKTKLLVLDEADQMLQIGFLPEVEDIIKETPSTRQTMLFSATMPDEIRKLARRHMKNPHNIQVEKTQAPLENIKQMAISTVDRAKQSDLIELLQLYRPYLGVIFCRTKRRVTKLYEALKDHGFNCDELHGDLSQAKREQVMKRFRNAEIQYLVATDVAARGLDVEGVTHVFNYDIPEDTESYIHRIGRTGRAGGQGLAITLYAPKDRDELLSIEKELNMTIPKKNIGNAKKSHNGESEDETQEAQQVSQRKAKKGKNERMANRKSREAGLGSRGKAPDARGRKEGTRGGKDERRGSRAEGDLRRSVERRDNKTDGYRGSRNDERRGSISDVNSARRNDERRHSRIEGNTSGSSNRSERIKGPREKNETRDRNSRDFGRGDRNKGASYRQDHKKNSGPRSRNK